MNRKRHMKVTVEDPNRADRLTRARRLSEALQLEVDADLVVQLIDSGSAPTELAGGLGRPIDAPPIKANPYRQTDSKDE